MDWKGVGKGNTGTSCNYSYLMWIAVIVVITISFLQGLNQAETFFVEASRATADVLNTSTALSLFTTKNASVNLTQLAPLPVVQSAVEVCPTDIEVVIRMFKKFLFLFSARSITSLTVLPSSFIAFVRLWRTSLTVLTKWRALLQLFRLFFWKKSIRMQKLWLLLLLFFTSLDIIHSL